MGERTAIAWTDCSFNIVNGCTKISKGCRNCYAERLDVMFKGGKHFGPGLGQRQTFGDRHWRQPVIWNRKAAKEGRPKLVFCSSICDVFEDHPTVAQELEKLWPLIRSTPHLIWQLLTKRANRIRSCLPSDWGDGYPNVWLGVSIETREYAWRRQALAEVPAVCRFISYEPALGSLGAMSLEGISWVIYGGESGPNFRPDKPDWARNMRTRCQLEGVAFFYKQRASIQPGTGATLDGEKIQEFPAIVGAR